MTGCYPVLGGLDLGSAADMHRRAADIGLAFKNLYFVSVESPVPVGAAAGFNLFCIGADYAPITLTGEKRQVGTAFLDSLRAAEPIELRLTALDSRDGEIKQWFEALAALAAPVDGTVKPPARYATRIRVTHSYLEDQGGGYNNTALYRPGTLENSVSRQDMAVEEITMTFVQLDTFMPANVLPWAGG